MLLHPTDNNILYAATSVGVYKTINGGTSWALISSNVYIDMEFKPGTPSTIYASNKNGDIYRSTNDGSSWTQTLSTSNARTELAVSGNNPAIVYAVVSDGNSGLAGIYKSADSGASFSQVFSGSTTNLLNWDCNSTSTGGQSWYDLCIASDPTNANIVFVGGVNTWKSTNGGTSWSISSHWSGGCSVQAVHADKHFLSYQNGTSVLYEGNDGGFYKTTNSGSSWTHLGSGLITSQIYRLGVAQTVANEDIAGLQDNGTKAYLSGSWSDEIGGDGFDCAIDYTNQNTLYGELYYGAIKRSTNHGSSWSDIVSGLSGSAHWCTPFVIDPNVHTTLYIGYQDVFKSTNQGTSWSQISTWGGSTLKSIAVAPSNSACIYAATSSILYRTTNGGSSWSNITGIIPVGSGDITYICIKNDDPNTVWVSLGGYNTTRVYQTTNGGTSWTNISAGLPSIPVMCLIQNKQNTSQIELYAGTDVGVYLKAGSANWMLFSNGLPNVVVTDLDIYYNATPANSRIRAGTFGRGVWQSDLYADISAPPVANFFASNTNPAINSTVSFTDASTNTPTSWSWEFSPNTVTYTDGTSSNSQNPQVQFNALGYYTVTLSVTNAYGSDQEIKTNYIDVVLYEYCIPTYSTGTTDGDYISLVQLGSINNATGASASPYYTYYSSLSTELIPNTAYTITLSPGTYASSNYIAVWIDYNQNGLFETSEKLGNILIPPTPSTGTINFTVPSDAVSGTTRMRVREVYSNTNIDPCASASYGETEDYNITIPGGSLYLDVTVFLEGPFNGTTMTPGLSSYIPLNQPYNVVPWNYNGTESVASVPGNTVDWVLVELRDAATAGQATPATMIGRQAAFLRNDGRIIGLTGNPVLDFGSLSFSNNLFVIIYHRNHISVLSSAGLTQTGGIYTYNFSTGSGQAYGGTAAHKQIGAGVWGMFGGDGDHSGIVGNGDKSPIWDTNAGTKGYLGTDYNLDSQSNNLDKDNIWVPNFGKGSQVPN